MAGKSDIHELRAYFNTLSTSQKKEFIQKLKKKLAGVKSVKYEEFLSECVQAFNREVKTRDKSPETKDVSQLDISAESFAIAFASLFAAGKAGFSATAIGPKLIGTWQREHNGKVFYYTFNDDGTLETNEVMGHETLKGHYTIGIEGAIHMEPHELLRISGLMLSVSGSSLTISFMDGSSYDYRRGEIRAASHNIDNNPS